MCIRVLQQIPGHPRISRKLPHALRPLYLHVPAPRPNSNTRANPASTFVSLNAIGDACIPIGRKVHLEPTIRTLVRSQTLPRSRSSYESNAKPLQDRHRTLRQARTSATLNPRFPCLGRRDSVYSSYPHGGGYGQQRTLRQHGASWCKSRARPQRVRIAPQWCLEPWKF
mgnify:CR=1 FL=1